MQETLQTTFEQALNHHLELHAIRCLEGLAELALARKEPDQALQHAERLQQLAEPGEMREIITRAFRWQGEALAALGKPELAIARLEQALALAETLGRPRLKADIHGRLANIFQAQGLNDKADQHNRQVEKIEQEITRNWQDLSLQANLKLDQAARKQDQPVDLNLAVSEILSQEPPVSVNAGSLTTLIGQKYIQEELIAVGGMGQVYRGHDIKNGQPVAIKRLKAELVSHNPEAVKRFIREGETLRQLNHPNIVKILATFEIENQPIIVMEYVSGGSLQDLLERQSKLPIAQILNLGLELADALARVHHLNIIHRDLKPANILLAEDGAPRLTDFGVAYLGSRDTRLTQAGAILGTTVYMSPEAWRGEPLDARSDIWSFGAVLFEMLAGQPPFAAENVIAVMTAILNNPIPDLYQFRPDTPPALAELIKHMLVKERHLRIDSMRQVAAGLEVIRRDLIE